VQLTDEQVDFVDTFRAGGHMSGQAGAGCGKSSTLVAAARAAGRRDGRLLTYNRAAARAAKAMFPATVRCSTMHGQAWHIGRLYAERNRVPMPPGATTKGPRRQYGRDVAAILDITSSLHCDGIPVSAARLGGLAIAAVNQWCLGIDPHITAAHVAPQKMLTPAGNAELAAGVVALARRAWRDICDLDNGRLTVSHDAYMRMWWDTGRARMRTDYILLDEAQDTNVLAEAILMAQRDHAQLVAVGDSAQALYEWRGAVDALTRWPGPTLWLSQSFRFGQAIADEANLALDLLGSPLRLRGTPGVDSAVGRSAAPDAVLCRTNAGAVAAAIAALEAGRRPALAAGAGPIREFAQAAQRLMDGLPVDHPDLFAFPNWEAVCDYVDSDDEGAADLTMPVGLVREHQPDGLIRLVDTIAAQPRTDVVMSTVHGAKGLEWPSVRCGDDLPSPGWERGNRRPVRPSDGRLAYVALTRPRHRLDVGGLAWLAEWAADRSVPRGTAYQQAGRADRRAPVVGMPIPASIPRHLHPAVRVARGVWQDMWPGMELDGTADLIVAALAKDGFLRPGPDVSS
jgi:hypothetical protein